MNTSLRSNPVFSSISPSEFFYRNRQMAGFGNPTQALYTSVRELVENSLDACEEARQLPEIDITIEDQKSQNVMVRVTDNGIGVPPEHVPSAFGTVLYGSKYAPRQRRGTFGLGVTMAILYGQITTNSPVIVHTRCTEDTGREFKLFIDIENNTPVTESELSRTRNNLGTTVTLHLKGDLNRARDRIQEYLQLTAVSSPHAKLTLSINNEPQLRFGGLAKILPTLSVETKPHPRGADIELLKRLVALDLDASLNDFIITSFQQVGDRTVKRFLQFMNMDSRRTMRTFQRDDLSRLSVALQQFDGFNRPESNCLSTIGKNEFLGSVKKTYGLELGYYTSSVPSEWNGHPFIIECVLATSGKFPKTDIPTLYRFANRVPLLYDATDDVFTKVLKRINWSKYGVSPSNPTALFLHFCSTRVPYNAAGKQSIAAHSSIDTESLSLFRALGRQLSKVIGNQKRITRDKKKHHQFRKVFHLLTKYSAELAEDGDQIDTESMTKNLFEVDT
ncbi:MAG: DNA topoisomerase VI subunit B [Candidatus Thorarchaeota archaeon]